eukprot:scpid42367/ scgid24443/ A-kinase anchor protein 10, mitochondrial; Dual specificity A kinase-anchoring protein 2; Protein kinase A-anchoring protein 10
MPFFSKKQDKETEERLEALIARRKERKASAQDINSAPLKRVFSSEAQASNANASCTTSPTSTSTAAIAAASHATCDQRTHSVASAPNSSPSPRKFSMADSCNSASSSNVSPVAAHSRSDSKLGTSPESMLPGQQSKRWSISKERSSVLSTSSTETLPTATASSSKAWFKWPRRRDKQDPGTVEEGCEITAGDSAALTDDNTLGSATGGFSAARGSLQYSATVPTVTTAHSSRLNVSLMEILSQNAALPYFLQYAESVGCTSMVQFWLAVESFRVSSLQRLEKYRGSSTTTSVPVSRTSTVSQADTIASSIISVTKVTSGGSAVHRNRSNSPSSAELSPRCYASSPPTTVSGGRFHRASLARGDPVLVVESIEDDDNPALWDYDVRSDGSNGGVIGAEGKTATADQYSQRFPAQHRSDMLEFKQEMLPRLQSLSVQRDALAIYKQYVSMQAKVPINIPIEVRQDIELGICQEDGFVSPEVFTAAQHTVLQLLDQHYYHPFLKSHFYCKFVIEILTSTTLRMSDIMLGHISAMVFTEFIEQEGALTLFHFWTLANSFQLDLKDQIASGTYVGSRALNDAMAIYERYFSLQATSPLHLGDEVRVAVEMSICCENQDGPQADCFALPMYHVYSTLEQDYLPLFLTSGLYFNFLSKLVNSVSEHRRADQQTLSGQHHHQHLNHHHHHSLLSADGQHSHGSPSSERREYTTQRSAHESLSAENVLSHFTEAAMGIDCGEDPDALWRRPKQALNFAYITELGEYVSEIEPYPDAKEIRVTLRQRVSHAVQRMMNTYVEDSERQEMASRVARMVVTNIMRQTGQTDAWILQAAAPYDVGQTSPEVGVAALSD